jgi:phage host-nuclease inhibitor protein Gam
VAQELSAHPADSDFEGGVLRRSSLNRRSVEGLPWTPYTAQRFFNIGRVLTHVKRLATKVKEAAGAVERILLPRLNSIDGELKSINTRIDSVNTRIDEVDKRNGIQFEAMRNELRGLSEKVSLVRDVEKLKVEVAELKRRRQ